MWIFMPICHVSVLCNYPLEGSNVNYPVSLCHVSVRVFEMNIHMLSYVFVGRPLYEYSYYLALPFLYCIWDS